MSITDFAAKLAHTDVPWWLARSASWALAGYALVTGLDYLNTPPTADAVRSLKMVTQLASLNTWGWWYVTAGGILLLGLMTGRHVIVWLGHFVNAILYAGFTGATFQAVLDYQRSPIVGQQGWIWRAVFVALMITLGHGALCWLRGPVPRRGDEA